MKEKILSLKIFAVISAIVVLVASISYYKPFESNALSQRTYLRYDYSNPNSSPYQYTISVPDTYFDNTRSSDLFPPNDMVRDYNTAVVRLTSGGTGFIIGQNTIVTAAHCVYGNNGLYDFNIEIVGDNNQVLDVITPHYVHIPKIYVDSATGMNFHDYALIYVDEDLSDYGMFGMGICLDSYVNNHGNVTVSGFPGEYPPGYEGSEQGIRFKASGNIIESTSNGLRLRYNADTAGGDSGGPVYVNESFVGTINGYSVSYDYNTVIAIHTQAGNIGVRINFDIMYFCYQNSYLTAS